MSLPKLPLGSVCPIPPRLPDLDKIEQTEQQRKQNAHDWFIAIFGIVGGGIAGFVSGLIVSLITK